MEKNRMELVSAASSLVSLPIKRTKDLLSSVDTSAYELDEGGEVLEIISPDKMTAQKICKLLDEQACADFSADNIITFQCSRMHIGSLIIKKQDELIMLCTTDFIKFRIPYLGSVHTGGTVFVPKQCITEITACFDMRHPFLMITTDPHFARSLRIFLKMNGNETNPSSLYFCPSSSSKCHQSIFCGMLDNVFETERFLRKNFGALLRVLPCHLVPMYMSSRLPVDTFESPKNTYTTRLETRQETSTVNFGKLNGNFTINSKDVECLAPFKLLNDTIMELWIRRIVTEGLPSNESEKIFCFDTFFYTRLTQNLATKDDPKTWYSMVERRTRNIDIFEKKILIVPINDSAKKHWFCAIICYPGLVASRCSTPHLARPGWLTEREINENSQTNPVEQKSSNRSITDPTQLPVKKQPCIIILDSMRKEKRMSCVGKLHKYLTQELKNKHGIDAIFDEYNMPGDMPVVPQQDSDSNDCGLYVLEYIEKFLAHPFATTEDLFNSWMLCFEEEKVKGKRKEIYQYIKSEVLKYESDKAKMLPNLGYD